LPQHFQKPQVILDLQLSNTSTDATVEATKTRYPTRFPACLSKYLDCGWSAKWQFFYHITRIHENYPLQGRMYYVSGAKQLANHVSDIGLLITAEILHEEIIRPPHPFQLWIGG
jgi:hypothetical protein